MRIKKSLPLLAVFSVYLFKVVFMYAQNCKEIGLAQTILPILILQLIGFTLFFVAKFLLKSNDAASLFSCVVGIFILNYSIVAKIMSRLMPFFRVWHIVPIAVIIIGLLVFALQKRFTNGCKSISNIICFTFSTLILINIGSMSNVVVTTP